MLNTIVLDYTLSALHCFYLLQDWIVLSRTFSTFC